jgi:hypothetical protein
MCLVNPNKASKEKTKLILPYNKNNAWFFQGLIKQSQSFETSHSTAKITKHTIKMQSSMAYKSLSRSLNKLLFVPLFFAWNFFSFPTPFEPFWNNSFDENQHGPEVKIHLDIKIKQDLNKNQGEKQKLNAVLEKENTRWTIRVKTRVFLAMKNEVCLPPNQTWCDPTIYRSKQNKRKLRAKIKTLQEKRIMHEVIKI